VRIICISDTHELHREVDVPRGDLLLHAGDFSFFGKRSSMLRDFNSWLGELPHRYKVIVPGNHDFLLEDPRNRSAITNAVMLIDSGIEIQGIKIWGSPVTPLYGVAFGISAAADRARRWAKIPVGTDIVITHGPAFGVLDRNADSNIHQGCPELLDALKRLRPRLHVCGHVHAGYGTLRTRDTYHVNAALFDEWGGVEKRPIVVDLEQSTGR
jgi:Icc-related predicted phosphoesterase